MMAEHGADRLRGRRWSRAARLAAFLPALLPALAWPGGAAGQGGAGRTRPSAAPASSRAPAARPVLAVPSGDSVYLYLMNPPARFAGFTVTRTPPGGSPVLLTPLPVTPVGDPAAALAVLGPDLPRLMTAVGAESGPEALRRLRSDPFVANIMTLMSARAARVLGRRFVDAGVTPGASYEYRVAYTDASGASLGDTATATVRVRPVLPAAPTRLRATTGDHRAALAWSYPAYSGDPGDAVVGFHVYRAQGDTTGLRRVTELPVLRNDAVAPGYVDAGLDPGLTYRYRVRAVDVLGRESGPSAEVTVTPVDLEPPAPPVDLVAEPEDGAVALAWRRALEPDATGYHVERTTDPDRGWSRATEVPLPLEHPSWVDRDVVSGTQYFYRVIALDRTGNESGPSGLAQAVPEDHTPPSPPAAARATVRDRRLAVAWSPSPSADVYGYYVYRGDGPDRLVRLVRDPIQDTTFVDSGFDARGLKPGGHYALRVTAVDRSYNESSSVALEAAVPDDEAPGPPTGVTAQNVLGRYVEVGWVSSPALDVAVYEVRRRPAPADENDAGAKSRAAAGRTPGDTGVVVVARVAAGSAWSVRDTTVSQGARYLYGVVAEDSAGNRSAAAAAPLRFGDRTRPASPRFVAARATEAGIEVHWERVASRDLAGYRVYRSDLPTGVFERLTPEPVPGLTFTDPEGPPGSYYVVRAVDRSGNESAASPPARSAPAAGQGGRP